MMRKIFATLFDEKYAARGVTMIHSLLETTPDVEEIHVLPIAKPDDGECWNFATKLMEHFEDTQSKVIVHDYCNPVDGIGEHPDLVKIRANRNWQEYCWTLASWFSWWLMDSGEVEGGNVPSITYLDADMYFFSDCTPVFEEIGERQIAIIPHRFIPSKMHLACNGKYNVSWISFSGEKGLECLRWWKDRCLEWCYYKVEPDRFGDQKYLDRFEEMYQKELCIISNPAAGLAPWNLGNYKVSLGPQVDERDVIFYHAHEFDERPGGYKLTGYPLREADTTFIYQPYIAHYEKVKEMLR